MTIEKFLNSARKFGINTLLMGSLYFHPIINNSYAENFNNTTKKLDCEEKILWTSYVLLNVVDAYQTANMPKDFRELNPLIRSWAGDKPSFEELLLFKAIGIGGNFYLYNKIPKDIENKKLRKSLLWFSNSLQLLVDLRNENVSGGILFKKTF